MPGAPLLARVRNRVERARLHAWRVRAYRSGERHVIVGGAPRSGTTLLRRLFDRHPGLCSGPETKLLVPAGFNLAWLAQAYDLPVEEVARMRRESPSQAAFVDAFAGRVRAATGKARWVEKTPMNIQHLDWITRHFPEAAIVHLIRDGRDVVCSMREHPDWRWVDGRWQKVLVPRSLEWYARRWVADTAAGMRRRDDPRYVEVRYEDLVRDPAGELRRLCAAIGEPVDEAWLAGVTASRDGSGGDGFPDVPAERARPDDKGAISDASVGRWRRDLTADEQAVVSSICGARLAELGYAPD